MRKTIGILENLFDERMTTETRGVILFKVMFLDKRKKMMQLLLKKLKIFLIYLITER